MANGVGADDILGLFHHIHHINGEHKVHHCGGAHIEVDPTVNYTIQHCSAENTHRQTALLVTALTPHFSKPLFQLFSQMNVRKGLACCGVPDVNIEFHSANPA